MTDLTVMENFCIDLFELALSAGNAGVLWDRIVFLRRHKPILLSRLHRLGVHKAYKLLSV